MSPSATTSGMPPTSLATTAVRTGHRLQVDDPQRLVDRRAHEHRGVAEHLAHGVARQRLLDEHHAVAGPAQLVDGGIGLGRQLGRVGRPGQQHDLRRRVELQRRPQQVGHALLAGHPPDERHDRAVEIDTEAVQHIGLRHRAVDVGVDPVVHDVDARRDRASGRPPARRSSTPR